jgi:uncharacterized repeat protein (TIGR01451 family)
MKFLIRQHVLSLAVGIVFLLALFMISNPVLAQGQLPFAEDFTGFTGSGFDPNPGAGQLDSDAWIVTGLSDGDLSFGGSGTTGDYARGSSSGGVTTGGIYAFDTGGGNTILGVQPTGSDWTPGAFILRLQNDTGTTITQLDISYTVWVYNNESRANSLDFAYSSDNLTYTDVPALDFTTPEAADGSPVWTDTFRSTSISGVNIANGDYFYLRWRGDDVSGSGSRDEYGIDDIQVTLAQEFSITKTAPDMVSPDQIFTYTLYITNGTGIATQGTVVTDTVPANAAYVPGSASDGGVLLAGDVVSWTIAGDLAHGAVVSRTFQVTASSSSGVDIVNDDYTVWATNWLTAAFGSPVTTTVSPLDLTLIKTGPDIAISGQDVVYTITLQAQGVVTAEGTILTDTLPLSVTYAADDSPWTANTATVGSHQVVTWSVGDVPSNTTYTFNLTATVHPSVTNGTVLTNSVDVSTETVGDDPANNSSQWETTAYQIVPIATARAGSDGKVFGIEGRVSYVPGTYTFNGWGLQDSSGGIAAYYSSPPPLALGDEVQLVATRGSYNGEEQMAAPVVYFANLGSGPEVAPKPYTTSDVDGGATEGWLVVVTGTVSSLSCPTGSGDYSFDVDDGSGTATVYVDKDTGVDVCSMGMANGDLARVIGFSTEYNGAYEVKPRRPADVAFFTDAPSIGKNALNLVTPGQVFTYTITVGNHLGHGLTNVTITDAVPANVTLTRVLDGGAESGGLIRWSAGDLVDQASVSVRFVVTAPQTLGPITNETYAVTATNYLTPTFGAPLVTNVSMPLRIHDIQGAQHLSPYEGQVVADIPGIVTVVGNGGFYMQDPLPDSNEATSEGIFVYKSSGLPAVGDEVLVSGEVDEYYPGGYTTGNLSTTQLKNVTVVVSSTGNTLPAPTVVGTGGRLPPNQVIENDATGDVNTTGVFDPANDGIDFYESLEGMLLQVNEAHVVAPTNPYGEIAIVGDNGASATSLTPRGGLVISSGDFNPERIIIDDAIVSAEPKVGTGDQFDAPVIGVLDYNFGNYKLLNPQPLPAFTAADLISETTTLTGTVTQLTIATFNVENLDPGDNRFDALATEIVGHLQSPDIIALEEIQDNTGPTDDGVVDASLTYATLITAVQNAGGPAYEFRDVAPANNQDGGEPGGNIRVGFLFQPDRVTFVDRGTATATDATAAVVGATGVDLTLSPGRIDPTNAAFTDSRKPLAGEFLFNGSKVFVVANHFNSKGGDDPLFGRVQPPVFGSEVQRDQQAQVVNDFVDSILALAPSAKVVVLGDLNDFQFSHPISDVLAADILTNLVTTLPDDEEYTYTYDGNSEVLDQILVTQGLAGSTAQVDVVHMNAEFPASVRPTDHDPVVARFSLPWRIYLPVVFRTY